MTNFLNTLLGNFGEGCGRTFLLRYADAGPSPDVTQPIVDRAMHARGIRATARVLHVSPTTVLKAFKNRRLTSSPCIRPS
jgi:transposase-like protein